MRPLYLFLLALSLHASATAQKKQSRLKGNYTSRHYQGKLFVKANGASLLDVQTPTIQMGLEYRLSKKVGLEIAYGIPVRPVYDGPHDTTFTKYYKLRAELRFAFPNRFFYYGPEVLFTHKREAVYDGYLDTDKGRIKYKYAEFHKNIVAFGIKLGKVIPLSEKWNLDGFFSLGARFKHLTVNPNTFQSLGYNSGGWIIFPETEGTITTGHVSVGLKFSYKIF